MNKLYDISKNKYIKIYKYNINQLIIKYIGKYWGLAMGDWGLGIGYWAQSPTPNPQSPIPNPQSP